MEQYTKEERMQALEIIDSTIRNCEKMQPKFAEGTSQHTLLKNRIKAMYISQLLTSGEGVDDRYTQEELKEALRPVASIISKCEKAKQRAAEGTSHHTRLKKIIQAMSVSETLIKNEVSKR